MSETAIPRRSAAERQVRGVLAVDPRAHLDTELGERHVAEPRVLEGRRHEDRRRGGIRRHDEGRQPLVRRAGDPDEVTQVRALETTTAAPREVGSLS